MSLANLELLGLSCAELLEISASGDQCCSAIGIGGVRGGDRISAIKSGALEIVDTNFTMVGSADPIGSKARSAAHWCCPDAEYSRRGDESQSVSSFDFHDFSPVEIHSSKWIHDADAVGAEFKFWTDENRISYGDNRKSDPKSDDLRETTFVSHSEIPEQKSPTNTDSGEEPTVLRSKNGSVHLMILSQQQLIQEGFTS